MFYVLLQLFGTCSDFQWSNKILRLLQKEYTLSFSKLVFWALSTSGGAAWSNLWFCAHQGLLHRRKDSVPDRRRLEDAAWILEGLSPVELPQHPAGFILLSSLALAGPDISKRQELAILFLLCLHEPTTATNPAAQDLLCNLNSIAAGTTTERELVKLLLLVSFETLIKCRLFSKITERNIMSSHPFSITVKISQIWYVCVWALWGLQVIMLSSNMPCVHLECCNHHIWLESRSFIFSASFFKPLALFSFIMSTEHQDFFMWINKKKIWLDKRNKLHFGLVQCAENDS